MNDPEPSDRPNQPRARESDHRADPDGDRCLSVIMPVYDERLTLPRIVGRVLEQHWVGQLIIVDDGSTDGSADLLRHEIANVDDRVRVLFHDVNRGKGAAIRTAKPHVDHPYVLIQDADLEYDPEEYGRLLAPLLDDVADVVYGSRFRGDTRRVLYFWHTLGNRLITLLSNACTNLNLTDVETCYKAFRSDVFREIPLRSDRFAIEPEITAKIARMGLHIYEVPISYHGRTYDEGKKIGWKDGIAALWVILREALSGTHHLEHGHAALAVMRKLRRYHRFVWSTMADHAGERVLEVGAGIGNMTQFIQRRREVWATDENPYYLHVLRRRFERRPNVHVARLDLDAPPESGVADELGRRPDTAVAVNVLEHVEDDAGALEMLHELLAPGGRLIVLVPAWPALYGPLDEKLGHFRRYRRRELAERIRDAGFELVDLSALNAVGALGWWLNVRLLRRSRIPGIQARINDLLVPWLRLERWLGIPVGLSWIAVARRVATPGNPE